MNRRSALEILFTNQEAGLVSDDEEEDHIDEETDEDDETELYYNELDVAEAEMLEAELLGSSSNRIIENVGEVPPEKRKRGRPRNNPQPINLHTVMANDSASKYFLYHFFLNQVKN